MISKRAPAKTAPGMWETTGGGAVAGESGLEAAVREVREELGIALRSESGRVFTRYTFPHSGGDGAAFIEVWVFAHECALSSVRLQPEETCDAMWASPAVIKRMIREGASPRIRTWKNCWTRHLPGGSREPLSLRLPWGAYPVRWTALRRHKHIERLATPGKDLIIR